MIVNKIIDNKESNPFKWKLFGIGILMLLFAIVILYFLTCNPKKPPLPPDVIPVKEQVAKVKQDSILSQKYKDSVQSVIEGLEQTAERWQLLYKSAVKSTNLAENVVADILNEPVPDTCKAIQARLRAEFDKVVSNGKAKDNACNQTILAKNRIIQQKDVLLLNSKEDYKKLKQNFDVSISQQTKLQNYAKSIKPRSEVYAGFSLMGNEFKPLYGYGISLGLHTKKGNQYEVGTLQFNNTIQYQISFKKRLFKL